MVNEYAKRSYAPDTGIAYLQSIVARNEMIG